MIDQAPTVAQLATDGAAMFRSDTTVAIVRTAQGFTFTLSYAWVGVLGLVLAIGAVNAAGVVLEWWKTITAPIGQRIRTWCTPQRSPS